MKCVFFFNAKRGVKRSIVIWDIFPFAWQRLALSITHATKLTTFHFSFAVWQQACLFFVSNMCIWAHTPRHSSHFHVCAKGQETNTVGLLSMLIETRPCWAPCISFTLFLSHSLCVSLSPCVPDLAKSVVCAIVSHAKRKKFCHCSCLVARRWKTIHLQDVFQHRPAFFLFLFCFNHSRFFSPCFSSASIHLHLSFTLLYNVFLPLLWTPFPFEITLDSHDCFCISAASCCSGPSSLSLPLSQR